MPEDSEFLHVVNAVNTGVDRLSTSTDIADALAEPVSTGAVVSEMVDNLRGGRGHVAEHRAQNATAQPRTVRSVWHSGFRHIVPIVPIDAQLSLRSTLKLTDRGKVPGKLLSHGWCGFRAWPQHVATEGNVGEWTYWGAGCGVLAAHHPAADIDIDDLSLEGLVDEIVDLVRVVLGPAPTRCGKPPKILLPFRSDTPLQPWAIEFRDPGTDRQHLVEFLGAGQQWVAAGRHKSGRPYTWARDPALPTRAGKSPAESLTVITAEQAERLRLEVGQLLVAKGFALVTEHTAARGGGGGRGEVDQEALKGTAAARDLIEDLMWRLPNTEQTFPSRRDFVTVAYALRATFADDLERGFALFGEWADRWPDNRPSSDKDKEAGGNPPKLVQDTWKGVTGPFQIGSAWLLSKLAEHGCAAEVRRLRAQDFDELPDEDDGDDKPDATSAELPEWLR